jgi:polysaccharide export outer membrane protein
MGWYTVSAKKWTGVMFGGIWSSRCLLILGFLMVAGAPVIAQDATGSNKMTGRSMKVVDRASPAAAPAVAGQSGHYAIGVADSIRINVWKNPDLSETLIVDPNGSVSLPLLGDVHVAGVTTNELGSLLSSRYASYVVTPQVTVSVLEIRSRQVYVMGQVGKAGGYPLLSPLTVLQLIAQAGGLTPYAKRNKIYVLRRTAEQSQKIPFRYASVTHGDSRQDIMLQPGDTVIVP